MKWGLALYEYTSLWSISYGKELIFLTLLECIGSQNRSNLRPSDWVVVVDSSVVVVTVVVGGWVVALNMLIY